jgi:excinuclease ABC subunit C
MTAAEFLNIADSVPHQPGIYKYFDAQSELLYVGKAKDLRKRIGSYFSKTLTSYKTHELVSRIKKLEFTIVDSEQDAFLLENSLIKQFQPRFNINLKDDKSYPYIVIKKEPFPRIFLTRKKIDDGSEYLGPFTSAKKVRELISFIRQFIPLRTCKLLLTETNIARKKFKVCLEYHLGNCKGPCEDFQTEKDYAEGLMQVRQMLKGNLSPVIQRYKKEMIELSSKLEFEKAAAIKKKIEYLENYQSKSVIVNKLTNVDVFSILKDGDIAYVNYLMVQNGTVIQTHTIELQPKLDETNQEVLSFAVLSLRETFYSAAHEIIVPLEIEYPDENILITVPKGGEKRKLLELSQKNVDYFREEIRKKRTLNLENKSSQQKKEVLYQLQQDLHLPALPVQIECFDNSNFQGSFPVSAMVSFKDGTPSKKDYRHFNVKTVEGINDFATMKEVVHRRYYRLLKEEQPLPQLIIIDGGKGQLSAAMESMENLNLENTITVVGLAKNEEEIFYPGDSESIKLPMDSESLKLIRYIRDEVHRFGITFHRNKRSKGTFKNELEEIKGVGKSISTQLLQQFRSVKKISEASEDELAKIIGKAKARIIYEHFRK